MVIKRLFHSMAAAASLDPIQINWTLKREMRLREALAEVSTTYQILYLDLIEMNLPLKDQPPHTYRSFKTRNPEELPIVNLGGKLEYYKLSTDDNMTIWVHEAHGNTFGKSDTQWLYQELLKDKNYGKYFREDSINFHSGHRHLYDLTCFDWVRRFNRINGYLTSLPSVVD